MPFKAKAMPTKQADIPRADPISTQTSGFNNRASPWRSQADEPSPDLNGMKWRPRRTAAPIMTDRANRTMCISLGFQ